MNIAMWRKALKVIPNVSREEWGSLDLISKWLISLASLVLIGLGIAWLVKALTAPK